MTKRTGRKVAFNFGARAGEIIGGGLARDPEGRFISAEALGSETLKALLARLKDRKAGKPGKNEAANRGKIAGELDERGLPSGDLEALAQFRAGKDIDQASIDRLSDAGLVEADAEGLPRLTPSGRQLINSANRGDVRQALDAFSKAREKIAKGKGGKKPKAGGTPKKTPEQLEAEDEAERRQNQGEVGEALAERVEPEDFAAFIDFTEGETIPTDRANALARLGLVEVVDGVPTYTSQGRAVARAADKGDTRAASDALVKAGERVERNRRRAASRQESAARQEERAADKTTEAERLESQAESLEASAGEIGKRVTEIEGRIDGLRGEMRALLKLGTPDALDEAAKLRREIDGLDAEADQVRAEVGGPLAKAERLRERARRAEEQAGEASDRAAALREEAAELAARIGGLEAGQASLQAKPLLCGSGEKRIDDDGPPRGDFEDEISAALAAAFKKAKWKTMTAIRAQRDPDYDELRKRLVAIMVPMLADAAIFAFNQGEEQFQFFFDDANVAGRATAWAQQRAQLLSDQVIDTTRNIVGQASEQAEQGASIEEIEATVDHAFNETRRERIGRTEATVALAFGWLLYQFLSRDVGVKIELIWYTRLDERVCPMCAPLHGKKQDEWSKSFPDGPPAHVQCRCGLVMEKGR